MSRSANHAHIDPELPLFARRLKAARLKAGLTQEGLGVAAGVDEFSASARINQYERGKHTPDALTATHLARVLKVTTAYFWAAEDAEAELLSVFAQMDAQTRKDLLQFAGDLLTVTHSI